MKEHNEMTCGEFLLRQRRELSTVRDLSEPGERDRAVRCLANIYAVSYQMHCERREPPSSDRGPAEYELLDLKLLRRLLDWLFDKLHAFWYVVEDPWRLGQAIVSAQDGDGFALIRMVTAAQLAKSATTPRRERTEPAISERSAAEPVRM